jgi:hypothetical protein
MKTYTIFGIMLVTGKSEELESVDKLAAGTHFLTAYGNKRGGKRKAAVIGGEQQTPIIPIGQPQGDNTITLEERAEVAIPRTEPPLYKVLKKDCQRWQECMEENPAQKLAGCGWSDGDVCDGYRPPEKEASHVSD